MPPDRGLVGRFNEAVMDSAISRQPFVAGTLVFRDVGARRKYACSDTRNLFIAAQTDGGARWSLGQFQQITACRPHANPRASSTRQWGV